MRKKRKPSPYERGKDRFHLGDEVEWQASIAGVLHAGRIVEVVKYGMYPTITRPPDVYPIVTWPELQGCHYYREHESYVVEDEMGKRWWPRVGNLRSVVKENVAIQQQLVHNGTNTNKQRKTDVLPR